MILNQVKENVIMEINQVVNAYNIFCARNYYSCIYWLGGAFLMSPKERNQSANAADFNSLKAHVICGIRAFKTQQLIFIFSLFYLLILTICWQLIFFHFFQYILFIFFPKTLISIVIHPCCDILSKFLSQLLLYSCRSPLRLLPCSQPLRSSPYGSSHCVCPLRPSRCVRSLVPDVASFRLSLLLYRYASLLLEGCSARPAAVAPVTAVAFLLYGVGDNRYLSPSRQ